MTANGRPVIPPHGTQIPPNGSQTPPWAVPQYQSTWQQTAPNPSPLPNPEPSGSLKLLWVITVLSGVLGVAQAWSSGHDAARAAIGVGLLGYFGVSLLVTLAVQALRHR